MADITMGADVEIFLYNDGPKSAIGLIGGGKHKPLIVENGNLQEDNVMAEFAIDPVSTKGGWINNLNSVYSQLLHKVGLHSMIEPIVEFPDTELQHRMAREFGCDPDVNAYEMEPNEAVDPSMVGNKRFAGGHIHVGMEGMSSMDKVTLAMYMDAFLGIPSVLMDEGDERRSLYGKAGTIRLKSYGVEYRTLSNFWIRDNTLIEWAYDATHRAVEAFQNGTEFDFDKIRHAIDNSDRDAASHILNHLEAA